MIPNVLNGFYQTVISMSRIENFLIQMILIIVE